MLDKQSRISTHYHKLQESLSELMDPAFGEQTKSFALIILNQTYTHLERLFELAENTGDLSRPRQAILAKLAHHIEKTKETGISAEFLGFIKADLTRSLLVIRDLFSHDFELAS